MIRPIFIIGCPRSGTTLVLEVMAMHEELAWVSNAVSFAPRHLYLSLLNKAYEWPFLGKRFYILSSRSSTLLPARLKRVIPRPSEPWHFWNTYLSNFQWKRGGATPPRRRTVEDIYEHEIQNVREAVHSICKYLGKGRFLSKYTDFPRIKYLTQAFPDALFLHVIRDGRAVAFSYHEKMIKGIFGNWNEREWWIQGWPSHWRTQWSQRYGTPLSFAAFLWKFFLSEIWKDAQEIPAEQYMEVKYSDIINLPRQTFEKILTFAGLKKSVRLEWYLDKTALRNMNSKWIKKCSDADKAMLDQIICEPEFRRLLIPNRGSDCELYKIDR